MFLFNTDGSGLFLKGEKDEIQNDPSTNDRFSWQFTDNETKIDIEQFDSGTYEVSDSTIIELTDDRLVYEATMQFEGSNSLFRITRVPAVKK